MTIFMIQDFYCNATIIILILQIYIKQIAIARLIKRNSIWFSITKIMHEHKSNK